MVHDKIITLYYFYNIGTSKFIATCSEVSNVFCNSLIISNKEDTFFLVVDFFGSIFYFFITEFFIKQRLILLFLGVKKSSSLKSPILLGFQTLFFLVTISLLQNYFFFWELKNRCHLNSLFGRGSKSFHFVLMEISFPH